MKMLNTEKSAIRARRKYFRKSILRLQEKRADLRVQAIQAREYYRKMAKEESKYRKLTNKAWTELDRLECRIASNMNRERSFDNTETPIERYTNDKHVKIFYYND